MPAPNEIFLVPELGLPDRVIFNMPIARSYTNLTRRYAKFTLTGVLALLALVVLVFANNPEKAEAAQVKCPQFRVMNNDRIGKVTFPAGYYNVTLLNGAKLTCPASTKLFQEFLQDWDGRLRSPWRVTQNGNNRVFRAGNTDKGFIATPAGKSGGGGGNSGRSCPAYFKVLRNDSIGSFKVPRGTYRFTLIDPKKITCAQAARRFKEFLLDFDGRLPYPWKLNPIMGIFYNSKHGRIGFKVNKAYGPSPSPKPDPKYGRCPATFRVLHNDRIGALSLPAGPYYIYVVNGLSCSQASNYFRQFLNRTDGRLPAPWRLNVAKAKFNTGAGGVAFRVQHA
jgi:hypothetical protein